MTDAVLRSTQGRIGILTVNNPPVNALAAGVRDGIKEGVEAFGKDANIDAIVLIGGGRTFIAGADIREFGKPPKGANLNDVIATMENCPKIVVAALHGTPLGGGLETALGAHYRVSLAEHARRPARGPSRPAARRRRHAAPAAPHRARSTRSTPSSRAATSPHRKPRTRASSTPSSKAISWPARWRMRRCWSPRTRRGAASVISMRRSNRPTFSRRPRRPSPAAPAASRRRGASSSACRPPSSCRSTRASSASASCSWNC